jgi:hypothetical protein
MSRFQVEASLLVGAHVVAREMDASLAAHGMRLNPMARARMVGPGIAAATLVWRHRPTGCTTTLHVTVPIRDWDGA